MSRRRQGGKLAPFIAMDRHQHKSAAFAALSAVAQALLVHLTYNYNTKLMNAVWLSTRDGAKKLHVSKGSVANAFRELEHYGFIVKVQGAYLGVSGIGTSAHYRLTSQRYGEVGATRDYEKWNDDVYIAQPAGGRNWKTKKQNPVHQEGQCVHQEGHKGRAGQPQKMEQASRHFWHILEPKNPPIEGWALYAIILHLEAVSFGEIKRLLVTVSPGLTT
jgi:DNA-binding transcriptional regulator YhcF (GntR family)